jgi:hypothetical protein
MSPCRYTLSRFDPMITIAAGMREKVLVKTDRLENGPRANVMFSMKCPALDLKYKSVYVATPSNATAST